MSSVRSPPGQGQGSYPYLSAAIGIGVGVGSGADSHFGVDSHVAGGRADEEVELELEHDPVLKAFLQGRSFERAGEQGVLSLKEEI